MHANYCISFLKNLFILFIYFWLHWVSAASHGSSLAAASGDHSSPQCAGFSLRWPLPLRISASRGAGSAVVARGLQSSGPAVVAQGPSCSTACGVLPDQGSNPCPLHLQADSQPLLQQGSPLHILLKINRRYVLEQF